MIIIDDYKMRLGKFREEMKNLYDALKIDAVKEKLEKDEALTAQDGFWNDMERSQKISQSIKNAKDTIADYEKLERKADDLATLIELADDGMLDDVEEDIVNGFPEFEHELEGAKLKTMLSGEYDKNNAILTFHAGAGGTEAQDWAEMLYRMYTRFAQRHDYKITVLDYLDGDEAGIKSASVLVEGMYAYGYLKGENGVHRLVRVSPFDSSGRRHTSFASLEVMPELDDDTEIEIRDDDLKVDTYRSSGAGGQHVNKTESAIRITHIPTGVVVACQNERSQHKNREMAMKMLKSKLVEIKEREHLEKIDDIKGEHMQIGWGSQIRSYVFMPYTLAKDHRTGFESGNINAVMDGDIDGFINAYLLSLAVCCICVTKKSVGLT